MEDLQKYVGKKAKGIKFESDKYRFSYKSKMDNYIHKIGTIVAIRSLSFSIHFGWGIVYDYPIELLQECLVEKEEKLFCEKINEIKTPSYYDNSNGSLYKVASERKWNAYLFDVVKRLERGGKKDSLNQEIEKSIAVLQLWLKETSDI